MECGKDKTKQKEAGIGQFFLKKTMDLNIILLTEAAGLGECQFNICSISKEFFFQKFNPDLFFIYF